MRRDLLRDGKEGRFFRGNLHCHSNRSDGTLERGRRPLVNAGDDANFAHPRDRFGGWVEVYSDRLDPEALLGALKAGRYYAT